jgi:predicted short-subunit dehydrogenase-like oxidoreductase (DUF2520 family)
LASKPQLGFLAPHLLKSWAFEVSSELKLDSEKTIANVSAAIHPEFRFMGLSSNVEQVVKTGKSGR